MDIITQLEQTLFYALHSTVVCFLHIKGEAVYFNQSAVDFRKRLKESTLIAIYINSIRFKYLLPQ